MNISFYKKKVLHQSKYKDFDIETILYAYYSHNGLLKSRYNVAESLPQL